MQTPQFAAKRRKTLQFATICPKTLQNAAIRCKMLQNSAKRRKTPQFFRNSTLNAKKNRKLTQFTTN